MKNLFMALAVLLLAGCAKTPDWDYDQSADFTNFKTFAWVEGASLTQDIKNYHFNPLMEKRVQDAVNKDLAGKGLTMVDAATADILINYHASAETKTDFDPYYDARWGFWGHGSIMNFQNPNQLRKYEVDTLIVDVIDRASNQLIWRGAKSGKLKKNQQPAKRTEMINNTVLSILSNFPPRL